MTGPVLWYGLTLKRSDFERDWEPPAAQARRRARPGRCDLRRSVSDVGAQFPASLVVAKPHNTPDHLNNPTLVTKLFSAQQLNGDHSNKCNRDSS